MNTLIKTASIFAAGLASGVCLSYLLSEHSTEGISENSGSLPFAVPALSPDLASRPIPFSMTSPTPLPTPDPKAQQPPLIQRGDGQMLSSLVRTFKEAKELAGDGWLALDLMGSSLASGHVNISKYVSDNGEIEHTYSRADGTRYGPGDFINPEDMFDWQLEFVGSSARDASAQYAFRSISGLKEGPIASVASAALKCLSVGEKETRACGLSISTHSLTVLAEDTEEDPTAGEGGRLTRFSVVSENGTRLIFVGGAVVFAGDVNHDGFIDLLFATKLHASGAENWHIFLFDPRNAEMPFYLAASGYQSGC